MKPFGVSMMRLGVQRRQRHAKLIAALDAAEAEQLDSDGDGIPDITELREGSDPNDGVDLQIPQTGCSLEQPHAGSAPTIVIVAGMAIALQSATAPCHPQESHNLRTGRHGNVESNATRLQRRLRKLRR